METPKIRYLHLKLSLSERALLLQFWHIDLINSLEFQNVLTYAPLCWVSGLMAKEIDLSLQIIYDFYQKNITVKATQCQSHVLF